MFWLKLIKPESLKLKLEQAKISANFFFLDRKLVNRVVRSVLLAQQKTNDCALLEIQKTYTSSLLLVLQAASDMSAYLTPSPGKDYRDYQIGIKSPLTKLKDSLSLVCKVSQSINQFHRNLVLLPAKFTKIRREGRRINSMAFWGFSIWFHRCLGERTNCSFYWRRRYLRHEVSRTVNKLQVLLEFPEVDFIRNRAKLQKCQLSSVSSNI